MNSRSADGYGGGYGSHGNVGYSRGAGTQGDPVVGYLILTADRLTDLAQLQNQPIRELMTRSGVVTREIRQSQYEMAQAWQSQLGGGINPQRHDNRTTPLGTTGGARGVPLNKQPQYAEQPGRGGAPHAHSEVTIAVCGQHAGGKSSLINALRGLKARDAGAASTKMGDIQSAEMEYQLSQNVKLCEFPSADLDRGESYLDRLHLMFERYDAVIVCSAERLTEIDIRLAEIAQRSSTPCYVIRTKIDRDVQSDIDDYGQQHNEKMLLDRIYRDIQGQLRDSSIKADIYMVSSKPDYWQKWHLARMKEIILDLPKKPSTNNNTNDAAFHRNVASRQSSHRKGRKAKKQEYPTNQQPESESAVFQNVQGRPSAHVNSGMSGVVTSQPNTTKSYDIHPQYAVGKQGYSSNVAVGYSLSGQQQSYPRPTPSQDRSINSTNELLTPMDSNVGNSQQGASKKKQSKFKQMFGGKKSKDNRK